MPDSERVQKKRSKRRRRHPFLMVLAAVFLMAAGALWLIKYAPTGERMELGEYFRYSTANEAALIVNSEYMEPAEGESPYAIIRDGSAYISVGALKSYFDDGYVWDNVEGVIRYATADDVISVNYFLDPYSYSGYLDSNTFGIPIVVTEDGVSDTVYLSLDFIKQYTDLTSTVVADGYYRIILDAAGYEKQTATLKKKTAVRRFGGPKSLILADGAKGDTVVYLEDYGKWSKIMTGDGVIGCVKNSALSGKESVVTPSTLPERVYNHMAMEKSVVMGWHQVTNPVANQYIGDLISSAKGLNVISPTWYYLNDNQGAIADFSSAEYVQTAHNNGIEVWALISNFENREVNTTAVLNTTSYRDRVVESLITSVIASGADGINVDFEGLEYECKDGFAAFIKELSIRCEQNGLYLSVDDYPPSEYTSFYGRQMQADYADYVILMGYDEYNGASPVAGPTASLPFVVKGIENTLREVPAERLILGMPFYTRVWSNTYGTVTSESMGMATVEEMIAQRGAAKNWLENDGLNYTEYMNEDTLIQIWVEDSESLAKKLALIGNYSLGGGAFWKLGLEPASIWDTVAMYFP